MAAKKKAKKKVTKPTKRPRKKAAKRNPKRPAKRANKACNPKRPAKRANKACNPKRPAKRANKACNPKRRPAKRPAKRAAKRGKRAKNARPSLLRLVLPVETMNLLAQGAVGDLDALRKAGSKGKKNPLRRRVRSGVKAHKGKGTRSNPFCHRVYNSKRGKRKNGEQEAAEQLYEKFHGRKSSETLEFASETRQREHLGGLGQLVELKYLTPTNYDATTTFADADAPQLAASPDGRSLYIVGGRQVVDLADFDMDGAEWRKDLMVIGLLYEVTYQTEKHFHAFQLIDYYHELGEESDVVPLLVYDTLNQRLLIVGGQYQVRPEGIVN